MGKKKQVKIHTDVKEDSKEDTVNDKKDMNENDTPKPLDPLKEMEEKVEALKKEVAENHDRMLRVAAEFENYKKRTENDQDRWPPSLRRTCRDSR